MTNIYKSGMLLSYILVISALRLSRVRKYLQWCLTD